MGDGGERPRTRGDCYRSPRPCPFVSCRHHLGIEVVGKRLKLVFADREVWELKESCSLDVAEQGGVTLAGVGTALGMTRERARQIEHQAVGKLEAVTR